MSRSRCRQEFSWTDSGVFVVTVKRPRVERTSKLLIASPMSSGVLAFVVDTQFPGATATAATLGVFDVRPACLRVRVTGASLSTLFSLLDGGAVQPRTGRTANLRPPVHDDVTDDDVTDAADRKRN